MATVGASTLWGEWVLGDLTDSARMVAELLGPSAEVASIRVTAPGSGQDCMPTITVIARNARQHDAFREAVTNGEYLLDQVLEPTATHWSGVVAGIYLVLTVQEA